MITRRLVGGAGAQGEPKNSGGLGPASSEASENQGATAGAPPRIRSERVP
jgi:hypothetical protein